MAGFTGTSQASIEAITQESYPDIDVNRFTQEFALTGNVTPKEIQGAIHQAILEINHQLQAQDWDDTTKQEYYAYAIYNLAASIIAGNRISLDDSRESAERNQALQGRCQHLQAQSRQWIDKLLNQANITTHLL